MTPDLRLYLVTDPGTSDLEAVVAAAVAGGVTCVQVRDKGDAAARAGLVRRLRAALPRDVAVVANDDVEAARLGDGLHVGVDDLPPSQARRLLGPDAVIGWSINHLDQLGDADELAACDYVAASPVWATPSKTDTGEPFGLDGVAALAAALRGRPPLVAIGGIDVERAEAVVAAGADGVAVVSAICAAADPRAAATALADAVARGLASRGASA